VATIKRAGERIITKVVGGQRRISCSCCPSDVECCMYPADQLGVGYTAEDLPDEIMWFINVNLEQRFAWPKVGDKYVRQFCDDEECYEAEIRVEGGQWLFGFDNNVPPAYWFSSNCLFQEGDEQGFKDNFADTYTVTTYEAFQITRTGLCTWFGLDSNGCETLLEYFGVPEDVIPFTDFPYKWVLSWSAAFDPVQELCGAARVAGPKEGFQNSPVGTYTDPLALVSATIA
jgi:hypothetical protein